MFKIQTYFNYILIIILLIACAFLYNRYEDKLAREEPTDVSVILQRYMLTQDSLADTKKPILWIHINREYNSRNWLSFGSRSSLDLNQPYMSLTIRSIVNQCADSFHICMIDDDAFSKLLPNWSINMTSISSPILDYIRFMGCAKLLYMYGGMIVPPSFLCMRNLINMYEHGTSKNEMFLCENIDRNITSTSYDFYPNMRFMGAQQNAHVMGEFIEYIQRLISSDFTSQAEFLGDMNRWCNSRIKNHKITLIGGKLVGVKTMDDQPILVDNLLSNEYIDIYPDTYGIYIPADEILNRRHYEWFARLSPKQVLESQIIISKYILLASAPDSSRGVIEPMYTKPNWVGYFKTDLLPDLWGLRPLMTNDRATPSKRNHIQ